MILLAPGYPADTSPREGIPDGLQPQVREVLDDMANTIVKRLGPLAIVTSRPDLESLLKYLLPLHQRFIEQAYDRLLRLGLALEDIQTLWSASREPLHSTLEEKAHLLGPDALQQAHAVIESIDGLNDWALDHYRRADLDDRSRLKAERINAQAAEPLLLAHMALLALVLIVTEAVSDWRIEAVPLLCEAADDHMTAVEDVFYAETADAPPGDDGLLPFTELRQQLGL